MASRELSDLHRDMEEIANHVICECADDGVDLLIYCTYRSLDEQARLYRQSRPIKVINAKARQLKDRGFGFLAEALIRVGPQPTGPHVTNAAPGESAHNYGEAFDAVPLVGGKAAWSYANNRELWQIYGAACETFDLVWAGNWKTFVEYPHAQRWRKHNPLKTHTPPQIEAMLLNPTI